MLEILKNIWQSLGTFLSSIGRVGNLIGDAMTVSTDLFNHSIFPVAVVSLFIVGLNVAFIYKMVGRT